MSSDIYVDIYRGGLQGAKVASNVYVQLDTMSQQEANYYQGSQPYFRFNAYIYQNIDLEFQDMLVDTVNLEPKTLPPNTRTKQYRVINQPETFPDGHIQCDLDRYLGNTP